MLENIQIFQLSKTKKKNRIVIIVVGKKGYYYSTYIPIIYVSCRLQKKLYAYNYKNTDNLNT